MLRRAIFLVVVSAAASASARAIDSYHFLPASATTTVSTPAPNNFDTSTASQNVIAFPSGYVGSSFNSLNPLDTVFFVSPSGGTTEYFLSETITNNSGIDWAGFTLSITDITGSFVFLQSPNFNLTPAPTSNPTVSIVTATLNGLAKQLILGAVSVPPFGPAIVPSGGSIDLTFSMDVPDNATNFSGFAIQQSPSPVPEPETLSLLALGGIGLWFARRHVARYAA
jgi:hypothetical protein